MSVVISKRRPNEERPEVSLATLLHFLNEQRFSELKQYLRWDFFTKLNTNKQSLKAVMRNYFYERYFVVTQPDAIHTSMIPSNIPPTPNRETADVAFIAVTADELVALKTAFGIPLDKEEDDRARGMRFWEVELPVSTQREPIDVLVTMIGAARTLECAAGMSTLFRRYTVGLCVLVGMAAGLKTKTKIGDVVVAYPGVLDYEGMRRESDGDKKRPDFYKLDLMVRKDLDNFKPELAGWHKRFKKALKGLRSANLAPAACEKWSPSFHKGIVLAGEILIADGSLPEMQAEYSERVRAAEQEGSGFARMCEENAIPWLVFRGVADYGDPKKKGDFQSAATLAAMTCAVLFIQKEYRFSGSPDADKF